MIKLHRKGIALSREERIKEDENLTMIENSINGFQSQVDELVVSGDSSPQATQASVGADGTTYDGNLKARLDAEHNKVAAQLAETGEQAEKAQTDLLNRRVGFENHPSLIRSHFGSLLGQWYLEGEGAGERPLTLTAQATSGATVLNVASFTGVLNGQLMVYRGVSGEYYTAKVRATTATSITFWTKIEETVLVGTNVWAFYNNSAHPNLYGYRAMADFALRQLNKGGLAEEVVVKSYKKLFDKFSLYFDLIGSPTISTTATVSASTPGSSISTILQLSAITSGDGVKLKPMRLDGGVHKYVMPANLGSGTSAQTEIRVKTSGGKTISTQLLKAENSTPRIIEGYFRSRSDETVWIEITQTGTTSFIQIGYIEIIKVSNLKTDLNNGTHVLLGDSWFAQAGIFERLKEKLPNAIIINKGVGGDKAIDLLGRFDADVTPNKPDYVWKMVSTNNCVAGDDAATFSTHVDMLITKVLEIGAKPIIFEPSVGAYVYTGKADGELSNLSRDYVFYSEQLDVNRDINIVQENVSEYDLSTLFSSVGAAASSTDICLGSFPIGTKVALQNAGGIYTDASSFVEIGFSTNLVDPFEGDSIKITAGANANYSTEITSPSVRFLVIKRVNNSASAKAFGATFKIKVTKP